jgi:hypothetical protein
VCVERMGSYKDLPCKAHSHLSCCHNTFSKKKIWDLIKAAEVKLDSRHVNAALAIGLVEVLNLLEFLSSSSPLINSGSPTYKQQPNLGNPCRCLLQCLTVVVCCSV